MKKNFEEPNILVERFNVTDQTLTVSWITPDLTNDETNAFGVKAIVGG